MEVMAPAWHSADEVGPVGGGGSGGSPPSGGAEVYNVPCDPGMAGNAPFGKVGDPDGSSGGCDGAASN